MRARLRRLRALLLSRRRDTTRPASTTDHSARDLPTLEEMTEQRIAARHNLRRRNP